MSMLLPSSSLALVLIAAHVFPRQTCVKWCSQPERDAIFVALQPHLLALSRQKYAVFLVKKLVKLGKSFYGLLQNSLNMELLYTMECCSIV
jgi:hypothetical protein